MLGSIVFEGFAAHRTNTTVLEIEGMDDKSAVTNAKIDGKLGAVTN